MPSKHTGQPHQHVRAFWTGPALSFYEQLSLKSILASGARISLYTYENNLIVPEGVEIVDARDVLPWPSGGHREENRYSAFPIQSDLFRYIALQKHGGWYVDLDLVLLRDRMPSQETYIVYGGDWVGTAVMRFPAGSPFTLEAARESQRILPDTDLSVFDADRATTGPTLIKRLLLKHGLDRVILPRSAAYEIQYHEALDFFDPARCDAIQERLADSDFTHLWNEVLRFVRIPKTLGPPRGSFLDVLFRRFGVEVSDTARLSARSVADWGHEFRLLEKVKHRVRTQTIENDTLDRFARSVEADGWQSEPTLSASREPLVQSSNPQTLRTFWHGNSIGPYQLLCLRTFVDRGHRVEVFTYSDTITIPDWLKLRNASDVLPRERVLRPLEEGGVAIHANLFRYALLSQLGGWWIDPDVVLLKPDLPPGDVIFSGPDAFKLVSTSVLRCPAGHPLLTQAFARAELTGDSLQDWDRAGSVMLTSLVKAGTWGKDFAVRAPLSPVSWFDVPVLFDPRAADDLNRQCGNFHFLQLHDDAWRRAGVPHDLGPPAGSILALLFAKHHIAHRFPARIAFEQLNRWLAHMYQSVTKSDG